MKKLFLPSDFCAWFCAPVFAASNTFSLEWTEDLRVSQWEDPNIDYMETGVYLYPYVGNGSDNHYFINTNPNDGSQCGVGSTKNGLLTMGTTQAVGNWNQAWTPQSSDAGSIYYDDQAAAFFASKSTAITGVYWTEPGQGAEGVTFITRGGRDYLIDSARNGLAYDMDPPSLVDMENYSPDQYESGSFDPSGMYVSSTPVSDFGFDLNPDLAGDQTTAYFMPRDVVEVAGELYGITYKYGPNDINDTYCHTAKATLVKMDTIISGDTAIGLTGHADMLDSNSPWYHGIQMWQPIEDPDNPGTYYDVSADQIESVSTDGTYLYCVADALELTPSEATYTEWNMDYPDWDHMGITTAGPNGTGVPIYRIDVDTAEVREIGWFYSDPAQPEGKRLEMQRLRRPWQHLGHHPQARWYFGCLRSRRQWRHYRHQLGLLYRH